MSNNRGHKDSPYLTGTLSCQRGTRKTLNSVSPTFRARTGHRGARKEGAEGVRGPFPRQAKKCEGVCVRGGRSSLDRVVKESGTLGEDNQFGAVLKVQCRAAGRSLGTKGLWCYPSTWKLRELQKQVHILKRSLWQPHRGWATVQPDQGPVRRCDKTEGTKTVAVGRKEVRRSGTRHNPCIIVPACYGLNCVPHPQEKKPQYVKS